jgi:hypothetical protein
MGSSAILKIVPDGLMILPPNETRFVICDLSSVISLFCSDLSSISRGIF